MNNYEYIIAGLPVLQHGTERSSGVDAEGILAEIRSQLSPRDNSLLDFLLSGFEGGNLDSGFYSKALSHRNRFIRSYFAYDLDLRNTKVEWINRTLSRPEGQDIVSTAKDEEGRGNWNPEFDGREEIEAVLSGSDILGRERGLDELLWKRIEEITLSDLFDIELILGFVSKLKIVDRWEKLDPETGQKFFRKLVQDIRATYDNKNNTDI